ncbi:MAG: CARDB domain-containing protein [Ignavibacteria bacterium]
MRTQNLLLRSVILIFALLSLALFDSCDYCPATNSLFCLLLNDTPFAEVTDSSSSTVVFAQDTIAVFHGSACARSSKDGTEDIIKIEGARDLPSFATNATVFLNGWKFEYLDKDHHVAGIGAVIRNIKLEENLVTKVITLKWEATGILSDKNFDDSYSMCYTFTVVAWADANVSLAIDQDDGKCSDTDPKTVNFFGASNENTTTALSSYRTFLNNPAFIGSREIAILPRGFGMGWMGGCDIDHKLLHIGYNLDHSVPFIKSENYRKAGAEFNPAFQDSAAKIDSGFVSWESHAIFKDNDARREYDFGEIVSGMSGNDVFVIDPPYSILPKEDDCGIGTGTIFSGPQPPEEFVIKNIPFQYAVPMLTGWELGYFCDDENIKRAGIRIENWTYTRDPLSGTGTLRYKLSSDFADKGNDNSTFRSHNVTILGIKPLIPKIITSGITIDLIPVIPPGSPVNSFCRRDPLGNHLFVTIKNQGHTAAPASTTSVMFRGKKVSVNTPSIKAGELVELQFRIPGNCYDPDCEFTITADSEKQIDEGSGEINNSVKGVCGQVIL